MNWFWVVVALLSLVGGAAVFIDRRYLATRVGELTTENEALNEQIESLRTALALAGTADPTLDDILGMFSEDATDA